MKPIIIKESNREKIQAALDQVQEKARVRTANADHVFDGVERIQEILSEEGKEAILDHLNGGHPF